MKNLVIDWTNARHQKVHRLVGFASGGSVLTADQKAALGHFVTNLKRNFIVNGSVPRIQLTGLHDSRGNAATNAYLAGLRAIAVRDYILSQMPPGFPKDRISTRSSSSHEDLTALGNPVHPVAGETDRAVDILLGA